MRDLTAEECEFVSGGEQTIIVTGELPPPSPPIHFSPSYTSPPPSYGGGGGGGGSGSYTAQTYSTDARCADGAAVGISNEMKKLLAAPSADAEYGAYIIKNADGSFGAYHDAIQTSYMPTAVSMGALPPTADLKQMAGFVNCVTWNSSDYWANYTSRYPANGDWYSLDKMVAAGANPANLSLYVLDAFGDIHEFHYTDKTALNNLTETQRKNGAMLAAPTPCS